MDSGACWISGGPLFGPLACRVRQHESHSEILPRRVRAHRGYFRAHRSDVLRGRNRVRVSSGALEFASANEEWRRESFRRVDQFLWKADTGLEIAGAMRLDLGNLITKLRAQVKTSSEASTAAANTQAKATTAAVTNAIEHTSEAIQAASGEVLPLKVEPLKSPITVNVPRP
jgi:hypothetical protein